MNRATRSRTSAVVLVVGVLVSLLAIPAAAQEADPYGAVLPRDAQRPTDVTAPPDADARQPGAVEPAARGAREVVEFGGTLPRTGLDATAATLAIGVALLGAGIGAVTIARRRARRAT